jgi:tetratricopeptide (TPR) repeat protein
MRENSSMTVGEDELRQLRAAAAAAEKAGNREAAIDALSRIAVLRPKDANAHGALAMALSAAGHHARAIGAFRNALAIDPTNAPGHFALGHALKFEGRFDEAIDAYRKSVDLAPDVLQALEGLGVALAEAGKTEEAIGVLRRALRLDDSAISVHFNVGISLVNLGQFDEAAAAFNRCLALDPLHPDAVFNLGMIALSQDRPDDALREFKRATALQCELRRRFDTTRTITVFRLLHEHQQAEYLSARGLLPPRHEDWRKALAELWARHQDRPRNEAIQLTAEERARLSPSFNEIVYDGGPCPSLPAALNPNLDLRAVEEAYVGTRPEIVVVDDLLSQDALTALRRFCSEATVFKKSFGPGYLNSLLYTGFATPLLLQITEELRTKLPRIFGTHRLHLGWGIKYDSTLRGIPLHADFAAVNVNFWITPDSANLDPDSGGLVLWDKESPPDWPFMEYNVAGPRVRRFLADSGAKAIRVPHKANRAVIFNSALFHETEAIRFRDTYEDRRVNVTLLYGRKLRVTSDSGF